MSLYGAKYKLYKWKVYNYVPKPQFLLVKTVASICFVSLWHINYTGLLVLKRNALVRVSITKCAKAEVKLDGRIRFLKLYFHIILKHIEKKISPM